MFQIRIVYRAFATVSFNGDSECNSLSEQPIDSGRLDTRSEVMLTHLSQFPQLHPLNEFHFLQPTTNDTAQFVPDDPMQWRI
jgi:hypothetical protein